VTPAFVCCLCSKRIGADRAHALLNHPPPRVCHVTCAWSHRVFDDIETTGTRAGIAALLAHNHERRQVHSATDIDARRARAADATE
jgi:hypothetical protein